MKKYLWILASICLSACTIEARSLEGHSCEDTDCAAGLKCNAELKCVPDVPEKATIGQSCKEVECEEGLRCNQELKCESDVPVEEPKAQIGESCVNVECEQGLRCSLDSKCEYDDPNEGDKAPIGGSCKETEDCEQGLICSYRSICESPNNVRLSEEGEACEENDHCDKGLFCHYNKCMKTFKEGDKCDHLTVCDAGLLCDEKDNVCAKAKLGNSCVYADCADGLICDDETKKCIEKPKGKAGDHCDKTEDCEDELTCEGEANSKTCKKQASEGDCFSNSDCKDPQKPICGDNYKCVEAPSDLCEGKCKTGEDCVLGICVTDAMKALTNGDDYPAGAADSFCNGYNVIYKGNNNKAVVYNCFSNGYTGCVVFSDDHNVVLADCNGQKAAIEACQASPQASLDIDLWRIDTCLSKLELYEVFCTKDLSGNDIAVPTYQGKNDQSADECGTCEIINGEPECSW